MHGIIVFGGRIIEMAVDVIGITGKQDIGAVDSEDAEIVKSVRMLKRPVKTVEEIGKSRGKKICPLLYKSGCGRSFQRIVKERSS